MRQQDVVDRIFDGISHGIGGWIITVNVDHFRRWIGCSQIRRLFSQADFLIADGMPLVWASRLRGNALPERVAGSDLAVLVAQRCAKESRSLYLFGGNAGVAARAARRLMHQTPELQIAGFACPEVSAEPTAVEIREARDRIREAKPDVVLVALGAPKQELLIAALRRDFPNVWWIGVGISLSFIAGDVRRAPRWLRKVGLEWLHRLIQEPRRLWRRYLLEDLSFALRLLISARRERARP